MRCERCQNTDPKYFYNDKGTYYCRRCIAFGRLDVGIVPKAYTYVSKRHRCNYDLEFQLTDQQLKASKEIVTHLAAGYDVLVYAACGFRVIIVTVANSLGNIRVFELLPKLKTKKYGWCIA